MNRTLLIFARLMSGETLNRAALEEEFGVTRRTIFRDLSEIQTTLAETTHSRVQLIRELDNYWLSEQANLDPKFLYPLYKVFLESRAFPTATMQQILLKLASFVSSSDRELLISSIEDELHHYRPVQQAAGVLDKCMILQKAINDGRQVRLTYKNFAADELGFDIGYVRDMGESADHRLTGEYVVKPLAVFFDNFYFFLQALDKDDNSRLFHVMWLDAIEILSDKAVVKPSVKKSAGELRFHSHFAYIEGARIRVKFDYYNTDIWLRDKWPDAKMEVLDIPNPVGLDTPVKRVTMDVVDGLGLEMWILSQYESIKILEPVDLRERVKAHLERMLGNYK